MYWTLGMTGEKILSELKRIRSASHCRSQQWMENELSRLIANLERPDPWPSYTLTSFDVEIREMP